MNKTSSCLLLFFLFSSLALFPETIFPLTLQEAIEYAISNHLPLKIEERGLKNRKLDRDSSGNSFYPRISSSFSSFFSEKFDNPHQRTSSLSAGVDISFPFHAENFVSIYYTINEYKIGLLQYEDAERRLRRDVIKAYYALQIEKEDKKLKVKLLQDAKNSYETALRGYHNGEISQIELLRKEYNYRSSQNNAASAENQYQLSLIQFKRLLNLEAQKKLELVDRIPEIGRYDISLFDQIDVEQSSSILALELNVIKQKVLQMQNVAQFIPSISLGISFSSSIEDVGKKGWRETVSAADSTAKFSFTLSVPLSLGLPFSKEQTALIKGNNEIHQVQLALEEEKHNKQAEMAANIVAMKHILTTYEREKYNVSIAEKAYQLSAQSYQEGNINYLEVSNAEADYEEAALKLLRSRYDFIMKLADIEYTFHARILK